MSASSGPAPPTFLLCRAGKSLVGLPVASVVEVMRPLPLEPLPQAAQIVVGVAIVRGGPVPVIDLAELLGTKGRSGADARLVVIRAGDRRVGVLVSAIEGVHRLPHSASDPLPPLLAASPPQTVSSIGARDSELLLTLATASLVPDAVFAALDNANATQ